MSESEPTDASAEPQPDSPEAQPESAEAQSVEAQAVGEQSAETQSVALGTLPPQGWASPGAVSQLTKGAPSAKSVTTTARLPAMPPVPPAQPVQPAVIPSQSIPQQPPSFPAQAYVAPPGAAPQQYPGFVQPTAFAAPPSTAAPARKMTRKRLLLTSGASVVALVLVAVGAVALIPGRTGDSAVSVAHCKPSDLTTCLIKPPAGAERLTSTDAWDQRSVADASLYHANIVTNAPGVATDTASLLDNDGLLTVAHTDWNAVDGNDVDLVLLAFRSQKGAQAWYSTRAAEILSAYRGQAVAIAGDTTGEAHAAGKADPRGDFNAAYSAVVGDLVLDVAYSSPKTFSAKDLQTWAGAELASLRTAPPAAADPADAPVGTQKLACGSGLGSCLMPMPGGSEHWTAPNDKKWSSSSTLTPSQFVNYGWDGKPSEISDVMSNFTSDGATAVAHQDWMVDGGNEQADIYLVQTITAAGAGQLSGTNFGEPDWSGTGLTGVSYTIPNEPNAQAWYTNKTDSSGFIEFSFTANIGNIIVQGWFFFYGSFDSGTANRWARTQLDRIGGTAADQPMGLFPLTAPSLPAATQGSCPSAGNCLLPVPAGASDTTGSSYGVDPALNSAAYADQYEPDLSSDTNTWLGSDGFESAEHRSWSAGNGATADAVLLKFGSPAQAQAAAQLEYGLNAATDRVCTDSAVANSRCLAEPVLVSDMLQKETIRVLAWKGDYEVVVSVTRSNAADVADAYTWAQQQLDLLPAG